jgi:Tfp pilus assembly pilus retraction ATPase PilT
MQVGQAKWGMVTLSQALLDLVQRRLITPETALEAATEPEELKQMLGVRNSAGAPAGRLVASGTR